MEDEFDLRPYISAIARRWRWIVLATVIGAAITAAFAMTRPSVFTATAMVFYHPVRAQVTMEERYISNADADPGARLKTIVLLAESDAVWTHIPPETRSRLAPGGHTTVKADGDLIWITASAPSAEQARDLANAWATAFVAYANTLYADSDGAVVEPEHVLALQERYAAAQRTYEDFLATSRASELNRRINAITGVISATQQADWARYSASISRTQQLDWVLRDAESLREQIADGRPVGFAERLAMLSLRSRAIGGELPVTFGFERPEVLGEAENMTLREVENVTLRDLDTFMGGVREQIAEGRAEAAALATALGKDGRAPDSSLTPEQLSAYNAQLLELGRQREAEEGRRRVLEQERNVALQALEIVQNKRTEQQVSALQPQADLRLANKAALPSQPASRQTLQSLLVGGVAGALAGLLIALFAELVGGRLPRLSREPVVDRRADYPSSG